MAEARLRRRGRLLGMLVAGALVAACGSTVQVRGGTAGALDGDGALGPPAGPGAVAQDGTGLPGSLAPGGDGPAVAGSSGASPRPGTSSGTAAAEPGGSIAVAGATGRGFTAKTVSIGIADNDVNSFSKAFGFSVSAGDPQAQADAVVRVINSQGGLLGRQVKLVWFHAKYVDIINNPTGLVQQACAAWTQDHPVFAVAGPLGFPVTDQLLACLAKTNTPLVGARNPYGADISPIFQKTYDTFPNFVNIGSMVGERFFRVALNRLVARGFFERWNTATGTAGGAAPVKIGVLLHEGPNGRREHQVITAELARHGLTISDVVWLSGSIPEQSAQSQNTILRFRSRGITHVLNQPVNQQGYQPRVFIKFAPQTIAMASRPGALRGAMAEGYLPTQDVAEDPGPPTAATTTCLNIMKASGQETSWGATQLAMTTTCDALLFLRDGARAGGAMSTTGLMAGLVSLGSRFSSATTWSTFVGPRQRGSANALRDVAYQEACNCFVYASNQNHSE